MKWEKFKFGSGWEFRSFTITPYEGDWVLKNGGGFVGIFKTKGSCKRVAQCIWREFGVTDETWKA